VELLPADVTLERHDRRTWFRLLTRECLATMKIESITLSHTRAQEKGRKKVGTAESERERE